VQPTERRSIRHREDLSTSRETKENKGMKDYGEYEIKSINSRNIMMMCFNPR